jgi:hypothetical protein
MLRCGIVCLLSVGMVACGSAAPSDLLIPHTVTMADSDSGPATGTSEGGADATTNVPPPEAGPPEAGPTPEASGCSPNSCPNGCCDQNDRCVLGTDDMACGMGGMDCTSCADQGEMCNAGSCTSATPMMDAGCDPTACPPGKCFFGALACCNMTTGACGCRGAFNVCQ